MREKKMMSKRETERKCDRKREREEEIKREREKAVILLNLHINQRILIISPLFSHFPSPPSNIPLTFTLIQ